MPVEQIFDTKEAAPEFLRDHLTETDGKFVFRAELSNETAGLKSALKAERDAKSALEKSLKGYEGIDATKARELLTQQQKAEEDKAKANGEWENWKAQMQATHEAEKRALEDKLRQAETDYETEFVDAKVTAEIANAKGRPRLLKPWLGAKSVLENGQRAIRIYDDKGNLRYGKDGAPMTVSERLAEMKADPEFMVAFEGSGAGGNGAHNTPNSSNTGAKTITRTALDQLSPNDRSAFFRDGGKVSD
jgi:hypothetical protein